MSVMLFLFLLCFQIQAYARIEMTPNECREKCSNGSFGWCLQINRNSTGAGATVDPFDRLVSLAHTPQVIFDNQCKQTIHISPTSFHLSGANCQIDHTEITGEIITSKIPDQTNGKISFSPNGEAAVSFENQFPTWNVRGVLNPPIGENTVQFITEGKSADGSSNVIWFDGYFCYSTPKL